MAPATGASKTTESTVIAHVKRVLMFFSSPLCGYRISQQQLAVDQDFIT
jgi:hypothetical protein